MYQAAQAALEAAGILRAEWTHAALQATFANELTRRRKLYSAFLARDLNVVQDLRHTADYRDNDVSRRQATRALAKRASSSVRLRKGFPMVKSMSSSERKNLVDNYLTELSLLAKRLCPQARIEATTEAFEDEDGHVRIYPPAGMREDEIVDIEGKVADRCVDILVEKGVFICSAVYD